MGKIDEKEMQIKNKLREGETNIVEGDTLISFIDNEINYIQNEIEQPGWTIWAIIGAIAICGWFLLDIFPSQKITINHIFLVVLLAINIYRILFTLINLRNASTERKKFYSIEEINENGNILVQLFHYGTNLALIYFTYLFTSYVKSYISIVAYLFYAFYSLMPLFSFLAQKFYFKFIPSESTIIEFNSPLIGCAVYPLLLIELFITITYALILKNPYIHVAIDDFKAATLIISIYILIQILINLTVKSPILSTLIEIRRDYVFGHISDADAKKRLEIALLGLQVSDIGQNVLNKVLSIIKAAESELEEAKEKCSTLKSEYQKFGGNITKDEKIILGSLHESIFNNLAKFKNIINGENLSKGISGIKVASYTGRFQPTLGRVFDDILKKTNIAISDSINKNEKITEIWLGEISDNEKDVLGNWEERVTKELKIEYSQKGILAKNFKSY
jgi:hypothetical protein